MARTIDRTSRTPRPSLASSIAISPFCGFDQWAIDPLPMRPVPPRQAKGGR